jgi:hypothetical protein
MSQTPPSTVLPVTDPDPIPNPDPTNDKLKALIASVITGTVEAVLAFTHWPTEQKVAVMSAAGLWGSLLAYVFASAHHAQVTASATRQAARMTFNAMVRRIP